MRLPDTYASPMLEIYIGGMTVGALLDSYRLITGSALPASSLALLTFFAQSLGALIGIVVLAALYTAKPRLAGYGLLAIGVGHAAYIPPFIGLFSGLWLGYVHVPLHLMVAIVFVGLGLTGLGRNPLASPNLSIQPPASSRSHAADN